MREGARPGLQRTLVSRTRILLLEALLERSPQTAAALAERLGLHHNTVREHLERLATFGLISRRAEERTVRGRPQVLWSPAGPRAQTGRAQTERALALGRAYRKSFEGDATPPAPATQQLDVIEAFLEEAGFRPRVDRVAMEVALQCPFAALPDRTAVDVCSVDAGVLGRVLARVDGPLSIAAMRPVAGTCRCLLALRSSAGEAADAPDPASTHPG